MHVFCVGGRTTHNGSSVNHGDALISPIVDNPQTQVIKQALAQGTRNLKILSDGGVTIALGTDSGTDEGRWQGYFEQVELEMMAKAGMTPMQVIVAATGAAAQVSKLDHVGTIAPGKAADLLVLDANPLQDMDLITFARHLGSCGSSRS